MNKTTSTWLFYQEVCFKYWPNKTRTGKYGKFSVETISEDAWGQDIVKRTFKLTNTEQVRLATCCACVLSSYYHYHHTSEE